MARSLFVLAFLLSGCVYQSGSGYEYSSFPFAAQGSDFYVRDRQHFMRWKAVDDRYRGQPHVIVRRHKPDFWRGPRPLPGQAGDMKRAYPPVFGRSQAS